MSLMCIRSIHNVCLLWNYVWCSIQFDITVVHVIVEITGALFQFVLWHSEASLVMNSVHTMFIFTAYDGRLKSYFVLYSTFSYFSRCPAALIPSGPSNLNLKRAICDITLSMHGWTVEPSACGCQDKKIERTAISNVRACQQ